MTYPYNYITPLMAILKENLTLGCEKETESVLYVSRHFFDVETVSAPRKKRDTLHMSGASLYVVSNNITCYSSSNIVCATKKPKKVQP